MSPPKTVHKTRARVKRKIKQPSHPYDKRIAVRSDIAEAAVERKALIKATGTFIKEVLPNATLVSTMKRESGIQTVTDYTTPKPSYKTPISTRIDGPLLLYLYYQRMKTPLGLDFKLPLMIMSLVLVK
jgi:hypothetical protein